jgi:hypothetical protein
MNMRVKQETAHGNSGKGSDMQGIRDKENEKTARTN